MLTPIASKSDGQVFGDEYEFENHPIIRVLIESRCYKVLERAEQIIHRDMRSHLVCCHKSREVVCAQLYALRGFSPSECISMYHYYLQHSLGSKAQVWLSTKGGAV